MQLNIVVNNGVPVTFKNHTEFLDYLFMNSNKIFPMKIIAKECYIGYDYKQNKGCSADLIGKSANYFYIIELKTGSLNTNAINSINRYLNVFKNFNTKIRGLIIATKISKRFKIEMDKYPNIYYTILDNVSFNESQDRNIEKIGIQYRAKINKMFELYYDMKHLNFYNIKKCKLSKNNTFILEAEFYKKYRLKILYFLNSVMYFNKETKKLKPFSCHAYIIKYDNGKPLQIAKFEKISLYPELANIVVQIMEMEGKQELNFNEIDLRKYANYKIVSKYHIFFT